MAWVISRVTSSSAVVLRLEFAIERNWVLAIVITLGEIHHAFFYLGERDAINGCLLRGLIYEKVFSFADIHGRIVGRADEHNKREIRTGIAI